ncbi:glycosyltransferase family 39 protein [Patescibacteria group bacterium]
MVILPWIKKNAIILILAAVFVNGIVHAAFLPLWQNHDESAHYSYIEYLVEQKSVPVYEGVFLTPHDLSFSNEFESYDQVLRSRKSLEDFIYRGQWSHQEFPESLSIAKSETARIPQTSGMSQSEQYKNPAAIYSPVYYALASVPYRLFSSADLLTRAFALRVFSVLIFLVVVYFSYLCSKLLFSDSRIALSVAAIIGFLPRLVSVSSGISYSVLIYALGAMLVYLGLKISKSGWTMKRSLLLGCILAVGILVKIEFAIFLPAILVLFILTSIKYRFSRWHFFYYGISQIIAIVLSMWWFVWNSIWYNNITGPALAISTNFSLAEGSTLYAITLVAVRYIRMFESLWNNLGCCGVSTIQSIMVFGMAALTIMAIGGGIFYIIRSIRRGSTINHSTMSILWLISTLFFLDMLLLQMFINNVVLYAKTHFPIDGRYFFFLIIPIVLVLVWGSVNLLPKRFQYTIVSLIAILVIMYNGGVVFGYLLSSYYM